MKQKTARCLAIVCVWLAIAAVVGAFLVGYLIRDLVTQLVFLLPLSSACLIFSILSVVLIDRSKQSNQAQALPAPQRNGSQLG